MARLGANDATSTTTTTPPPLSLERPAGLAGLPVAGFMHGYSDSDSVSVSVLVGDSQDSDPFGPSSSSYAYQNAANARAGPSSQHQQQQDPQTYSDSQFQATQEVFSQTQPATQPVASGPSASRQ